MTVFPQNKQGRSCRINIVNYVFIYVKTAALLPWKRSYLQVVSQTSNWQPSLTQGNLKKASMMHHLLVCRWAQKRVRSSVKKGFAIIGNITKNPLRKSFWRFSTTKALFKYSNHVLWNIYTCVNWALLSLSIGNCFQHFPLFQCWSLSIQRKLSRNTSAALYFNKYFNSTSKAYFFATPVSQIFSLHDLTLPSETTIFHKRYGTIYRKTKTLPFMWYILLYFKSKESSTGLCNSQYQIIFDFLRAAARFICILLRVCHTRRWWIFTKIVQLSPSETGGFNPNCLCADFCYHPSFDSRRLSREKN